MKKLDDISAKELLYLLSDARRMVTLLESLSSDEEKLVDSSLDSIFEALREIDTAKSILIVQSEYETIH